ncbi:MAG: hypothetical protein KJZ86_08360 [Caldilineaceae bacterium]|nr:hypothetical protein [Caldilineaceae bacterium]HRJ40812.1 DUF6516 family protein [Caldilineaceae bacterium]
MSKLTALADSITRHLQSHSLCSEIRVIETKEFSSDRFRLKIRTYLPKGYNLQISLYVNFGHIDYSYQMFSDRSLLRWDNKEEYRNLNTFPHHHHQIDGSVVSSPLMGIPMQDLPVVLHFIERYFQDIE